MTSPDSYPPAMLATCWMFSAELFRDCAFFMNAAVTFPPKKSRLRDSMTFGMSVPSTVFHLPPERLHAATSFFSLLTDSLSRALPK